MVVAVSTNTGLGKNNNELIGKSLDNCYVWKCISSLGHQFAWSIYHTQHHSKTGWLTPVMNKNENESTWSNKCYQGDSLSNKMAWRTTFYFLQIDLWYSLLNRIRGTWWRRSKWNTRAHLRTVQLSDWFGAMLVLPVQVWQWYDNETPLKGKIWFCTKNCIHFTKIELKHGHKNDKTM